MDEHLMDNRRRCSIQSLLFGRGAERELEIKRRRKQVADDLKR